MNDLIKARLVYDGGDTVFIPPEMGEPRADQMQGTAAEKLSELAGRVCYDSLGKGRASFTGQCIHCRGYGVKHWNETPATKCKHCNGTGREQGYHDHILEVGHGSVLEHFNFTVETSAFAAPTFELAVQCLNRPGLYVEVSDATIRVTCNLRSVREWVAFHDFKRYPVGSRGHELSMMLMLTLVNEAHILAPNIVESEKCVAGERYSYDARQSRIDNEHWISMFMSGSRGLSHELVRHGDFTAISQRSTRFVDESESPWVEHPLETSFHEITGEGIPYRGACDGIEDDFELIDHAKQQYQDCVETLEPWLISRGIDRTSARKQARGAARGYLGNALSTELIFSANVAQWRRMLRQRASRFADAEIRELFCKALGELKRSRYAESFNGFDLQPSPDGIGQVAVEK